MSCVGNLTSKILGSNDGYTTPFFVAVFKSYVFPEYPNAVSYRLLNDTPMTD